jgi:hypothetical protein
MMTNVVRAVLSSPALGQPSAAMMRWLDMNDAMGVGNRRNCRRYGSDVIVGRHVNPLTRRSWRWPVLNFHGEAGSQPV